MVSPALAQFVTATAGRNMTKAAHLAIILGTAAMVMLTVSPHRWIDGVLWACLAFFAFEWVVRIRHAVSMGRVSAYMLSGRGLLDAAGVIAVPLALLCAVGVPYLLASRRVANTFTR